MRRDHSGLLLVYLEYLALVCTWQIPRDSVDVDAQTKFKLATCGAENCLLNGYFWGCTPDRLECICTKEQHYVDQYVDIIEPCLTQPHNCTKGAVETYLELLQGVCYNESHQITSMGGALSTYLVASLASPTASSTLAVGSSTAATATTTASIESSSTSTAGLDSTSRPTAAIGHGLSNGAIAGIAVGVAVPSLALIGIGVVYLLRRRKAKKKAATASTANTMSPYPEYWNTHEPKDVYGRPAPVSWDASTYADEQTLAAWRASEISTQPWPAEVEGSNERCGGVAEVRGSGGWGDEVVMSGMSDARNTG